MSRFEKRLAERLKDPEFKRAYEAAQLELIGAEYLECGCMATKRGMIMFGPVSCKEHGDDD